MNPQSTLTAATAGSIPAAQPSVASPSRPEYKLFDRKSVLIASLLGSPVAGAVLMAMNQSRWGERSRALTTVVVAVLATALVSVVGYLTRLDTVIPQYAFIVALTCALIAMQVAHGWQGGAIQRHVEAGGELASRWLAAGVGLALLAVIIAAIAAYALLADSKVVIGSNDKVHYSAQATKPEALQVGAALKASGYFKDRGLDVFLSKDPSGTRVSFVLTDGAWDRPEVVAGYEKLALLVAAQIGFPLHLALVDERQQPRKDLIVGKLVVGTRDTLHYFGSSTQAQARALGEALKSAGYLQDRGVMVLLSKDDNGTSISFPVVDGTWDKQDAVDYFVELVRRNAAAVGGVPIKLRLMDGNLEIRKELLVT